MSDLQDELEELQQELEDLGKFTPEEKKELAAKSDEAIKRRISALSRKYKNTLQDIRSVEQEIAEEEGRTPPEAMSDTEAQTRSDQFGARVFRSIKDLVGRERESSAEGNLRSIKVGGGRSLYDVLDAYLKQAVPFDASSGQSISIRQMFVKRYDEIGLKNIVSFPDEAAQKLLAIADKITGDAGEEIQNFVANFRVLQDAEDARKRGAKESLEDAGTYSINVGKFFGAIDLSDSDSRDSVYEYWKDIDEKYDAFSQALLEFLESAEKSKDEKFAERARKFKAEYTVNIDDESPAKMNKNLRYVYDIPAINMERDSPKNRLIRVIENIILAEGLADTVEAQAGAKLGEEDVMTDEQTQALSEFKETFSDAMEMDLERERIIDGDDADTLMPQQSAEAEEFYERLVEDDVDVLLAIEMAKNKKLVSATDDMATELRQYLDMAEEMLNEGQFQTVDVEFERLKKEAKQSLVLERPDYFVPISALLDSQVMSKLNIQNLDYNDIVDSLDFISNFFEDLEVLMKNWEDQTIFEVAPRGGQAATTVESREDPTGRISGLLSASAPIIAGKKTKLPKYLEEQKEALRELVQAIINYYVNPIYSGRMPVSIPEFSRKLGFKDVLILAEDLGAETTTGKEYMRATSTSIDSLDKEDIRNLRQFFTRVFAKRVKPSIELIQSGRQAIQSLTELFDNEEANANYISAVLFDVMRATGDTTLADREISGPSGRKSIMERANLYSEAYSSNKAFPIFGLPLYLDMNEGLFYNHPDKGMKAEYDGLVNILKEAGEDLPVVLKALLEAHDEIRKALGKEVQHGFVPLSYEAINKYLVEEDIDLTTFEVESIVKSYDSHKNISNEYGIGTEDVYLLKANFR